MTPILTPAQATAVLTLIDKFSQEGIPNVRFNVSVYGDEPISAMKGIANFAIIVRGTIRQTYWITKSGKVTQQYSQYIYTCFVKRDHIYD